VAVVLRRAAVSSASRCFRGSDVSSAVGPLLLRRGCASGLSTLRGAGAWRWRVAGGVGLGIGGIVLVGAGAAHCLEISRAHEEAASHAEAEEQAALREQKRQAEVDRLRSQASLWRLAELVLTMLPVVFALPVWLVDPGSFWSFVAVRIDCCGPTFVKLAQWLSTRRDIFPETLCAAFSSMQNKVAARWSEGLTSVQVAAGLRDNEVAIRSIEPKPHASGSIAEVFFAVLEDGTDVAVKCLRPGTKALLEADLAWLLRFSQLADKVEMLRLLGVRQAAEEFCEHVQMQTDFQTEASHLRRFRANFAESTEAVRFPAPLFVTPEALVLSRESGQELAEVFKMSSEATAAVAAAPVAGADFAQMSLADAASQIAGARGTSVSYPVGSAAPQGSMEPPVNATTAAAARADQVRQALGIPEEVQKHIARESMAAYMRMIFCDKFIHGDLHPGNIMLAVRKEETQPTSAASEGVLSSSSGDPATVPTSVGGGGFLDRLRSYLPAFAGGSRPQMPSFELVILDAGLAIPLPQEKVEVLRSLAIAIIYADFSRAADILYQQSPDSSRCWDPAAFKRGLAKAFQDCRRNVWEEGFVQVSDACLEALRLVQYYNVGLDTTLTWTLFGMLSVEGSARQLDPAVDCAQAATRYIITVPSLLREMHQQSWTTTRHMIMELVFSAVGYDYWDWRYRRGLTWQDLQT